MIYVESKKKSLKTLQIKFPEAVIIDVTSGSEEPWVKLSPFYPHGEIPIPFSEGYYAYSVEGIWQGLKVFEEEDIDISKFLITNMKGIKRTVRKYGNPLGHRKGVKGDELLDYMTARKKIYLPAYAWILDHKANEVIMLLKAQAEKKDVVLLDFETNSNIDDPSKPLSHASLVKRYLEKKYPELSTISFTRTKVQEPLKEKSSKKTKTENGSSKNKKRKKNSEKKSNSVQLNLYYVLEQKNGKI